jgi:hypothetical protein
MSQGDYIRFLKTVQALQTNREPQVLTHTEYTSIQTYNTETSVNNTKSAFGEVSYSDTTRLLPSEDLQAVNTGPTNQGTTASSEDAVLLGATQTLTNKTFTNPVINGLITGTYTIKDSAIPANILRTDTTTTFTQNIVQTSSGIISQTGTGTNSLKETTLTYGNLTLTSGNIIFSQGNKTITNGSAVLTLPTTTTVLIGDNTTNTLTHKTLTSPTINNPVFSTNQNIGQSETGIINQTGTGTNSLKETTITSGNLTLTSGNIILSSWSSIKNGSITLTLPSHSGNDSFVSRTSTDTLTNKTLTSPTINNPVFSTNQNIGQSETGIISQTGTGTNSLKETTITSGNLTLTSGNIILSSWSSIKNGSITLTLPSHSGNDSFVSRTSTDTLTNKTLTSPTINNPVFSTTQNIGQSSSGIISQTGTGTNSLKATTITSGNLTLTSGNLTLTSGNLTLTSGNIVFSSGIGSITNGTAVLTLPKTTTVLIGDNTSNTFTQKNIFSSLQFINSAEGTHITLYEVNPTNPRQNYTISIEPFTQRYNVSSFSAHVFSETDYSNLTTINRDGLTVNTGTIICDTLTESKIKYLGLNGGYDVSTGTNILRTNVPTGATHHLSVNNADIFSVSATATTIRNNITLPASTTAPTNTQLGGRLTSSISGATSFSMSGATVVQLGTCSVGPGTYIINVQFAFQCTTSGPLTKEEYSINTANSVAINNNVLEIVNHTSFSPANGVIICKRLSHVYTHTSSTSTNIIPVVRLTFTSGAFSTNSTSNPYVKFDVNRIA